LLHRRIP